jgi:HTH-type transcriptional regulator, cell division transcriptional repressor
MGVTTVGERLKQARENAVISQAELGARSGVGEATVNRIERGHVQPRYVTVRRLAEALNVEPRWLLKGESPDAN